MANLQKKAHGLPKSGPRALAMRLRILSCALEREVDRTLAENGELSLAQFMLLAPIVTCPGVTQRAIASKGNLTEAAISRQAEALRKKGYLVRDRNPDRLRERSLHVTPAGRKAFDRVARLVDRRLEELFGHLPAERQQAVIAALDDVLHSNKICPLSTI